MIWDYCDTANPPSEYDLEREFCIFCKERMELIAHTVGGYPNERIRVCQLCGWWSIWHQSWSGIYDPDTGRPRGWWLKGAIAQLRDFDGSDISQPLEEVRRYLIAKY